MSLYPDPDACNIKMLILLSWKKSTAFYTGLLIGGIIDVIKKEMYDYFKGNLAQLTP